MHSPLHRPRTQAPEPPASQAPAPSAKERLVAAYKNQTPKEWGERVAGVKTQLDTSEKVIALTFDACGGPRGGRVDTVLIEFLRKEKIPATLFISGSWIDANPAVFKTLAADPLFEIENHGLAHKPCSVNGNKAYGIKGTASVAELVDEIEKNGRKIEAVTGGKPKFYRPGTAYCDEVAVKVAGELGYEVVNYNVLGDAGATCAAGEDPGGAAQGRARGDRHPAREPTPQPDGGRPEGGHPPAQAEGVPLREVLRVSAALKKRLRRCEGEKVGPSAGQ